MAKNKREGISSLASDAPPRSSKRVGVPSPSLSATDSEDAMFGKVLISGLLDSHKGVPVYVQDKSLAFRLRLPTQHSPVLCMQPWV
jgi:hypothetical protein